MSRSTRWFLLGGVAVALLLAVGVSHWASSEPDGLDRVAIDHGLDRDERPHTFRDAPLAGYRASGLGDGLGLGVAGLVGVGVCFAIAAGAAGLARRRRGSAGPPAASAIGTASPVDPSG
jgi:cobalt/nickel transport system permease protein